MISTQKLTLLAFSYHDGQKPPETLTMDQKYYAIKYLYTTFFVVNSIVKNFIKSCLPNIIEFFSYILNFQGIIIGPTCCYKDYMNFIHGYNYLKEKVFFFLNQLI